MERGQQQLEAVEQPKVALDPEPVAVAPERAPVGPIPVGARGPEGTTAFKHVLEDATPEQRQKFVLQLQRTAGNAAVCRWLAAVGERYAERLAGGGEPPEDPDAARPR